MSDAILTIQHDGDNWQVINFGAIDNGKIYLHLASTTRFMRQKNGKNPVQIGDWLALDYVLTQRINYARAAGRVAAVSAAPRIPTLCLTFRAALVGLPVGSASLEISKAWLAGYQEYYEEQAAEFLQQS